MPNTVSVPPSPPATPLPGRRGSDNGAVEGDPEAWAAGNAGAAAGPENPGTAANAGMPEGETPNTAAVRATRGRRLFASFVQHGVALLGIVASGIVCVGVPESEVYGWVWLTSAVVGLAVLRWLPLTSTFLWWGAGALAAAGFEAGDSEYTSDYTDVDESDFTTLYGYNTYEGSYVQLSSDSSGHTIFESGYDDSYEAASGESYYSYTEHIPVEAVAAPALILAALCLIMALNPRRHSALAAACGLTLAGLGISWLAFGEDEQIGVYAVVWGVITLATASVEVVRRRRRSSGSRPGSTAPAAF